MNSTSQSNSRAWRLIVGVLPIDEARSITVSCMPTAAAYSRARGTVWSLPPSSTTITLRGLNVCRAIDARQWTMLSSSLYAGMTTSTIAVRQSCAGVGTVLSGPCSSPIALSSAFGLRTNQGAVAIACLFESSAFDRDDVVDRAFQRVFVFEAGQRTQARQARPATADVLEVLAVRFAQRHVLDGRAAARALDDEFGEFDDADLAVVADVGNDRVAARAFGQRIERDDGVACIAEGTRLLAAAEHGDGLVAHGLRDEARHDHAVSPHLARADGVEEARDDRRDAVTLRVGQAERFVGDLAHRIAPARAGARADRQVLVFAEDVFLVVAVHLRRGGDHHLRLPAARVRGAQQALAAGDVGGEHLGRLGQHAVDADDGGQVIDAVGPAHRAIEPIPGQDVGFVEPEVRIVVVVGEVLSHAGRQIIDHVDLVAARQMEVGEVGADEAGTPGNEDVHGSPPPGEGLIRDVALRNVTDVL